jgi:hypothetical protein
MYNFKYKIQELNFLEKKDNNLARTFFFCNTGVWTQGLAFANQELYHVSHAPSPFVLQLYF